MDALIKYEVNDGQIFTVTLSEIRKDIGFEYGLADNVLHLIPDMVDNFKIIDIKILT